MSFRVCRTQSWISFRVVANSAGWKPDASGFILCCRTQWGISLCVGALSAGCHSVLLHTAQDFILRCRTQRRMSFRLVAHSAELFLNFSKNHPCYSWHIPYIINDLIKLLSSDLHFNSYLFCSIFWCIRNNLRLSIICNLSLIIRNLHIIIMSDTDMCYLLFK